MNDQMGSRSIREEEEEEEEEVVVVVGPPGGRRVFWDSLSVPDVM